MRLGVACDIVTPEDWWELDHLTDGAEAMSAVVHGDVVSPTCGLQDELERVFDSRWVSEMREQWIVEREIERAALEEMRARLAGQAWLRKFREQQLASPNLPEPVRPAAGREPVRVRPGQVLFFDADGCLRVVSSRTVGG